MNWLSKLPRPIVWGLAFLLFVIDGWLALEVFAFFRVQLTIFLTAILLSFVLSYPVQWLSQFRLKRSLAVLLVLLVFISALGAGGVLLVPPLMAQINDFSSRLPTWLDSGLFQAAALQTWAESLNLPLDLTRLTAQIELKLTAQIQSLSAGIFSQLPNAVSAIVDIGLTIVLTLYLLLHGEKLWDGIFQWLPKRWNEQARPLIKQNFQNYFLGQLTVALLMGTTMTIAFVLIKVPFGLLFGIAVGVMALFPFGASVSIAVISCLTALKSIWLGVRVLAVAESVKNRGKARKLVRSLPECEPFSP